MNIIYDRIMQPDRAGRARITYQRILSRSCEDLDAGRIDWRTHHRRAGAAYNQFIRPFGLDEEPTPPRHA